MRSRRMPVQLRAKKHGLENPCEISHALCRASAHAQRFFDGSATRPRETCGGVWCAVCGRDAWCAVCGAWLRGVEWNGVRWCGVGCGGVGW